MARPKAPDYDLHRDRILGRATDAFAHLGYASASMAQLAQACNTSKAGLYHYFPSKEAILFESLDRYTRRLSARLQTVQHAGLSAQQELAELVRTLLREYRDSRSHHVALLNDVKFLAPAQREQIKAQEREVVDAVARSLARVAPARFSGPNRTAATMAMLGMVNFTFAWLRPEGAMSYEAYAEMVIDLWSRSITP